MQITHCKCGYTHVMKGNQLYSYKTKPVLKLKTIADFFRIFNYIFNKHQNISV